MIVRRYQPEDASQIQGIFDKHHKGKFGVPNLAHVISSCVVEKDGQVLGYGALETMLEGIMILDLSLPLKIKLEILKHIIDSGVIATKFGGYERFYSSPSPNKFGSLLSRHFKFKKCDPYYHLEVNDEQ